MPIKKSIFSSSRTEPYYAPCGQERAGTKCKVIQLKNLKCRGTLIKHKTPVPPLLVFNSFNFENNPLMDVHDSANLRVQLVLSHDTCYLPGIFTQQESLATTTASARSSADDEMLLQSKSVFTGHVHITVKGQSGVLFQDLKVQLSGYSSEFVCLTQFGEKVVRLLKDLTSDSCSHLRPMIQDTIHFKPKLTLLSPGTYTYPFNFVLDPYHFHASIGTHLGSTQYRMELTCTIMRQKGQYETIFLSRPFTVKKTLPPGNLLRYDCVESQGTWRDGLLDYKIYLSTKLLEFDQPFQFHLHLVKGDAHQIEVQAIEVILEQNMLIPCVKKKDLNKPVAKAKSYMATNMFLLAKHTVTNKHDIQHIIQFPDLTVSSSKQSIVMSKSLHPYYCEMSDTFGSDRCKLKITHVLKAQVSLRLYDGAKVTNMLICLKLPVLLVDKDMSSGLHLPPYQEFCSVSDKDTLSTLCPTLSDDSHLCSSPPTYAELFDSIYPPTESSS
ncbi:AaceriAFL048Wp [[Ashbya] aceris (nom. inval.)]|nr:AaceriAFL048Wp [[Ashbya] aceris (nom. inval.)]